MKRNVKKTIERVEKVVELNGRFYCLHFDKNKKKITMKYSIQYIEVMNEKLLNEIEIKLKN